MGTSHDPGTVEVVMPQPDPDERFSLYPAEGEDVLKRLLGAEEDDGAEEISEDSEDEEPES